LADSHELRTIGWFGPRCPRLPGTLENNNGMEMWDYATDESLSFPLQIATNIFWGAATIVADFTIEGSGGFSASGLVAAEWGQIAPTRSAVATAQEMLCLLGNNTHTFNEDLETIGDTNIRSFLQIATRPTLATQKLHAPFSAEIAYSSSTRGVGALFTSNSGSLSGVIGDCNWTTPWGQLTTPLRKFGSATGGSIQITVTAADPATRYGQLFAL
jgi:hypothetical protein